MDIHSRMKISPTTITVLEPHQVFVFGSNIQGIHGKGATLLAKKWRAQPGQGEGRSGQTYAIPTRFQILHPTLKLFDTLPLPTIGTSIGRFIVHALAHPNDQFLVTAIGCGLAGLEPIDLARFFRDCPENVWLPQEFVEVL